MNENSIDMKDVYESIDEDNPGKRQKIIVFDDMIADMISNKNFNLIVTELFVRGIKLNITLVFITNHTLKYLKMSD